MPIKEVIHTTQAELNRIVNSGNAVRVGYTNDAQRRASEYSRDGYTGTMLTARTTNGRRSEQRLLDAQFSSNSRTNNNVHRNSNISSGKSGRVYIIKK